MVRMHKWCYTYAGDKVRVIYNHYNGMVDLEVWQDDIDTFDDPDVPFPVAGRLIRCAYKDELEVIRS